MFWALLVNLAKPGDFGELSASMAKSGLAILGQKGPKKAFFLKSTVFK